MVASPQDARAPNADLGRIRMIGSEIHHNDPVALATRVRGLLDRQHELLVRLDDLSRRQMTLIEADKGDRLLELMDERQHVIDRLRDATEMLDPLRTQWASAAPRAPAPVQEAIRSRTEAVASLLDQIGARDQDA